MAAQITRFGTRGDGATVDAITLRHGTLKATVLTHGAVLQSLHLDGVAHSLTLGFPDISPYEGWLAHFGSVIAPVANRINGAQAMIDGRLCRFERNQGDITLHSGAAGSHNAVWAIADHGPAHVTLSLSQQDGAGGFTGNRRLTATYRLTDDTLHLEITARTDAPTLMNIAHHGYWNLDGAPTWAGHTLCIHADHILPSTPDNLPTGEIADLTGHALDMREARRIAPGETPPLDHNFCLADARRSLTPALRLTGASGVTMDLATTEPGLQIFGAATINAGDTPTIHNRPYRPHAGLAIEPQFWPDAPNHANFPPIRLNPGDTWRQHTTYRFTKP